MSDFPNFDSLFTLDGKVALITGGSRGIGLYAASAILRAGASKVIITARNAENLKAAADKLNALPNIKGKAIAIPANVGHTDDIERLVKLVSDETGHKVNILIANAAASWGGPFEPFEDWKSQKTLDLNVRGIFNLVRFMVPLLEAGGSQPDPSRIIIVSSVGGIIVPHVGTRGSIMYSVSKAAAHHLGRNLAMELITKHITTNIISPGFFPSRLAMPQIDYMGGEDKLGALNPRGRLGKPEDIAGVIIYLCSKAGNYVNGEDIALDGGQRLQVGGSRL